jgi:hypothetical protein
MTVRVPRWGIAFLATAFLAAAAHAQTSQGSQTGAGPENPGSIKGDTQPAGSEPPHGNAGPTADSTPAAPIGSSPETTPAKFNEDVAARDRIPIMARPLALSDEQKRQIYDRIMNNAEIPVTQTTAKPASILPASVELSELSPPVDQEIPAMRGYKYVKLPDRVLVVSPSNRVVVGEVRR